MISVNDPTLYHPPQRQTGPPLSHPRSLTPPSGAPERVCVTPHLHAVPASVSCLGRPLTAVTFLFAACVQLTGFSNLGDLKASKANLLYTDGSVHRRDAVASRATQRRGANIRRDRRRRDRRRAFSLASLLIPSESNTPQ